MHTTADRRPDSTLSPLEARTQGTSRAFATRKATTIRDKKSLGVRPCSVREARRSPGMLASVIVDPRCVRTVVRGRGCNTGEGRLMLHIITPWLQWFAPGPRPCLASFLLRPLQVSSSTHLEPCNREDSHRLCFERAFSAVSRSQTPSKKPSMSQDCHERDERVR